MFGSEDLARFRINEATQEGMRSQQIQRCLQEKPPPVSERSLVKLIASIILVITSR